MDSGIETFQREEAGVQAAATMRPAVAQKAGQEKEMVTHPLMPIGQGLAALPKKVVERIKANEYVDFAELPPAKGKARPVPQSFDGQVIVVQAEDLMQSRKNHPGLGHTEPVLCTVCSGPGKGSAGRKGWPT